MISTIHLDPRIVQGEGDAIRGPYWALLSEVDDDSVEGVHGAICAASSIGQQMLPIVIDSDGGTLTAAFAILDMLAASKLEIITVVRGRACSAAAVILSAGKRRIAAPASTMMVHDAWHRTGAQKADEAATESRELTRQNRALFSVLDRNTGHASGYWRELTGKVNLYLTPRQALRHGLITQIGVPRLATRVTVETILEVP